MKQTISIAAAALLAASLSTPASARNETLAGKWSCAAHICKPLGGPTFIILLEDNKVVCVNEQGDQQKGTISKNVITGCWNLTAQLSLDGRALIWSNDSYWVR